MGIPINQVQNVLRTYYNLLKSIEIDPELAQNHGAQPDRITISPEARDKLIQQGLV